MEMLPGSGVNLAEYRLLPYPDTSVIRFLYMARVMKEKGIEQFLELARHYADREDVEFHICGDCEEDYLPVLKKLEQEKNSCKRTDVFRDPFFSNTGKKGSIFFGGRLQYYICMAGIKGAGGA